MKQKTITPDNYQDFKPSEFIRSFVSDIEVAEKLGKPMDMGFWDIADVDDNCLPCLGGMACMNMGIPVDMHPEEGLQSKVAKLGDSIRMGTSQGILARITALYPQYNYRKVKLVDQLYFSGEFGGAMLQELKERVHMYADAFEKAGC